jgi:hypothetical protein
MGGRKRGSKFHGKFTGYLCELQSGALFVWSDVQRAARLEDASAPGVKNIG